MWGEKPLNIFRGDFFLLHSGHVSKKPDIQDEIKCPPYEEIMVTLKINPHLEKPNNMTAQRNPTKKPNEQNDWEREVVRAKNS